MQSVAGAGQTLIRDAFGTDQPASVVEGKHPFLLLDLRSFQ